jgi:hypothetical protein
LFKRGANPTDMTIDNASLKVADVSWAASSTNDMVIDADGDASGGGALQITGDGSDDIGATLALSAASDLSENLVVGKTYRLTFDAKVGSGDSVDVEVAQTDDTELAAVTISSTSYASYQLIFTASNASTDKIQLDNLADTEVIYLDNFKLTPRVVIPPGIILDDMPLVIYPG